MEAKANEQMSDSMPLPAFPDELLLALTVCNGAAAHVDTAKHAVLSAIAAYGQTCAAAAIQEERVSREAYPVSVVRYNGRSKVHEYRMSDGSLRKMQEKDALLAAANYANSLARYKAEVEALRKQLALGHGLVAVGEIVAAHPVHGWHMHEYMPWNEIGAGTILYAAPAGEKLV